MCSCAVSGDLLLEPSFVGCPSNDVGGMSPNMLALGWKDQYLLSGCTFGNCILLQMYCTTVRAFSFWTGEPKLSTNKSNFFLGLFFAFCWLIYFAALSHGDCRGCTGLGAFILISCTHWRKLTSSTTPPEQPTAISRQSVLQANA